MTHASQEERGHQRAVIAVEFIVELGQLLRDALVMLVATLWCDAAINEARARGRGRDDELLVGELKANGTTRLRSLLSDSHNWFS